MKGDLVVSVYKEDVSWLHSALETGRVERVFVYNKGGRNLFFADGRVSVIDVPNIGREGETFLRHMIENWDSIPDRIWFCQGDPFEHAPDFVPLLGSVDAYGGLPFWAMSHRYKASFSIPPNNMVGVNDAFHVKGFRCSPYFVRNMQLVGHCAFRDYGIDMIMNDFRSKYGFRDAFGYLSERLGIATPGPIADFAYSACFHTLGGCVRRHPKWVYEDLRNFLFETDDQGHCQGFILERFWAYLLSGRSYNSLYDCYRGVIKGRPAVVWDSSRRTAWIKDDSWSSVVENPDCVVGFLDGGRVRHLAGIDLVGPDLKEAGCSSIGDADGLLVTQAESERDFAPSEISSMD